MSEFITQEKFKAILKEYRLFTRTTAIYPKEKGVLYCSLGLQNEIGELIGKIMDYHDVLHEEFPGEAGDILWYITRFLDELGINLEDLEYPSDMVGSRAEIIPTVFRIEERLGDSYGLLKKSMRGDKEFDKKAFSEKMNLVLLAYMKLLACFNTTIPEIVEQNTKKLSSRKERGVIKGDGDHR